MTHDTTTVITLGDALPKEMARVRDQIMPTYQEIGPAGAFALVMMRADLDRATHALAVGDVIAMMQAYDALTGYKL
jgi:hypothetical protein